MDAHLCSTLVSAGLIGLVVMMFSAFGALGLWRAEVEAALSGDSWVARPELSRVSFMVK